MPKKGLLDPQGRAIKQVIKDNGINVLEVRAGKCFYVDIEDKSEEEASKVIEELAREVFSNPIIEDYIVEKL